MKLGITNRTGFHLMSSSNSSFTIFLIYVIYYCSIITHMDYISYFYTEFLFSVGIIIWDLVGASFLCFKFVSNQHLSYCSLNITESCNWAIQEETFANIFSTVSFVWHHGWITLSSYGDVEKKHYIKLIRLIK